MKRGSSLLKWFSPTPGGVSDPVSDEEGPSTEREDVVNEESLSSSDEDEITFVRSQPSAAVAKKQKLAQQKSRKTGIDSGWQKKYIWMVPTPENKGMLCKLCIKHKSKSTLIKKPWTEVPCVSLFEKSLRRHANSGAHRDAVKIEAEERQSLATGGIERRFENAISMDRMAITGAAKCLYWLAKNDVPHTTKYEPLLDLMKLMGCEYLQNLHKGENAKYTSRTAIDDLLSSIVEVIKGPIYQELLDSPCFSLMTDETTDISVLKQLIMYGKYLILKGFGEDGGQRCVEVATKFLVIRELVDGKAETITHSILKVMDDELKVEDKLKLTGFGSDGASVMVGKNTGVATRLRDVTPNMLNVHCIAHRLALAAGQAAAGIDYLVKFKDTLRQLFNFYQNSSVRFAGLMKIEEVLQLDSVKLKDASDTRWLSHQQAIDAIRRCYVAVVLSLEKEANEKTDATAAGLSMFVRQYDFVACISMLSDALPHLTRLSLVFQRKNVDLTVIEGQVNSTIRVLEGLLSEDGEHMARLEDWITEIQEGDVQIVRATRMRKGAPGPEHFRELVYRQFLENVIQNLKDRFPDITLLKAFSIFDPEAMDFEPLQRENLQTLTEHFGLDQTVSFAEWKAMKALVQTETLPTTGTVAVMKEVVKNIDLYPNLGKLASIALTLPVSTAECERGFSKMKLIKSRLRNRMAQKTLENLMFISMEGPEIEDFNFDAAIDVWSKRSDRRLTV